MALAQGTRLGHYEVTAPLGAGGMGEVYRARDARIGRDVAVKALSAAMVQDAERLRRFEQEAQAAGRLNHPNVLTVHDVGVHDGVYYLVCELLEGETLRARLGGSPLPMRKATEIASQIARGLAAAHEHGIVHRDLKPENVFVTKDGQVKILDFGLAKLTRAEILRESESAVPTEGYATDPGTVMGTAGYMSPEQVRGRAVDQRSDIFSLGAILYEMLSGRRAFARDSSIETLNAILKEDPPELSGTGRPIPPALERIVRHCLEKSPGERFASARDLAFDLEALSDTSAQAPLLVARPVARRRAIAALAGLGLIALGALPGFLLGRKAAPPAPTYTPLTFRRGRVVSARFAPDGKSIFYSAAWEGRAIEVFAIQPGFPSARSMGAFAGVVGQVLDELAVATTDGTLVKIPLTGGAARPFLSGIARAFLTRDGSRMGVVRRASGQDRLEFPAGNVRYETPGQIFFPRASPDGSRVAFSHHPVASFTNGRIAVIDDAGSLRYLTGELDDVTGLAWSADGREVWYTASFVGSMDCELRAASLDGKDRLVAGLPGSLLVLDIGFAGDALLAHEKRRYETRGRGPGESQEHDLSWFDRTYADDLTPDGRILLFNESGRGGGPRQSAFVRPVDGSPAVRVSDGYAYAMSPDARWVAVDPEFALQSATSKLVLMPTGAGESRPLPTGTVAVYADVFRSSDGKRLLLAAEENGRPRRLFIQDFPDGEPRPITPEGVVTHSNTLSPDGQWLAAGSYEPGSPPALYPVAGGPPRPIRGLQPRERVWRWSGDGRSLFVGVRSQLPLKLEKLDLATGRREPWLSLAPPDVAGVFSIADVHLSSDGRAYAYTYSRNLGDLYLVEGLR